MPGRPATGRGETDMGKRLFSKAIEEACEERGIECKSFSEDWVYLLKRGDASTRVIGYCLGLNGHAQSVICDDKAAASDLMEDAGVPHVRHVFMAPPKSPSQRPTDEEDDPLFRLMMEHGTLVVKPNVGREGEDVLHVSTSVDLVRALRRVFEIHGNACVCPYVDIDEEYRVVVLDGAPRLAYRKIRPHVTGDGRSTIGELVREATTGHGVTLAVPSDIDEDEVLDDGQELVLEWRHNLITGALASMDIDDGTREGICSLAVAACEVLDVRFASVDVIASSTGLQVLEVNGTVIMERILGQDEELYGIAKGIYADAIELALGRDEE